MWDRETRHAYENAERGAKRQDETRVENRDGRKRWGKECRDRECIQRWTAVIDNAAHGLLALGAPSIGPLTNSLTDTDIGLRQMAVLTLSGGIRFGKLKPIPDETVTALIETLGDTSSDIRDEAARALADLGPQAKGALPALRQMAASDPADAVRLVARRAIEQIESRP